MTDTQTAFVLVPRDHDGDYAASGLPPEMIEAGQDFLDTYNEQSGVDWDNGMVAVGLYRAMLSAAPKPPESETGPVAWGIRYGSGYCPLTDSLKTAEAWRESFNTPTVNLYPQSRIDADAAIIAALRAEVAQMHAEHVCLTGNMQDEINFMRGAAAKSRTDLEAAEARVKELESNMDLRDVFIVERELWADFVAQLPATPRQAALASKKETVD